MSSQLWAAYYEDDVDTFRQLLATTAAGGRGYGRGGLNTISTSPGAAASLGTSPTLFAKTRKTSGTISGASASGVAAGNKVDINLRDAYGLTLLHHVASSSSEHAIVFATALLDHPNVDLYIQDYESAWTALHRAFYFGNISIARLILEREADVVTGARAGVVHPTIGLVKVKDREGFGPLDLYAATISDRTLRPVVDDRSSVRSFSTDGEDDAAEETLWHGGHSRGDEVYTFGSNKNITLGFGDEDDRQYPERITLRRPEGLIRKFHAEALEQREAAWATHHQFQATKSDIMSTDPGAIPWITKTRPTEIQEVYMAKYHTAVLTADPESNLYICGHGQGGRLGTGDERTRFHFVCIDNGVLAGKRISTVALGQNHTLALSSEGDIYTWGNNGYGQLGYSLPRTATGEEDPITTVPRQIFGPLKREEVLGVAASRIHSVAFTSTGLYTFGKNEGQLGIVDSDARSLEIQTTPRRVAASLFNTPITSVSAIDKATICLLENHDVWIFANYGYTKVPFPLEGFSNYFLKQSFLVTSYDNAPNRIVKVTAGGDTVCALSSRGEIFTLRVTRHDTQSSTSTTNPAKIRSAITQPQCVWSLKKANMAARDVGVDADGSIILSTQEGSVWKRTKRAHMKDGPVAVGDYKPKDYKFSRIPGLTRVLAVRASAYGAYAAIRRDCDVTRNQIVIEASTLWHQVFSLSPLKPLADKSIESTKEELHSLWHHRTSPDELSLVKNAVLRERDIESLLQDLFERRLQSDEYNARLVTTTSSLQIPVHRWLLTGRSRTLRRGFRDLCETSTFTIPDLCVSELDKDGRAIVKFSGMDVLTMINLVFYLYSDTVVEFWNQRDAKENAYRYRQIRTELMKVATKLELVNLEPAVRQMIRPRPCMNMDLDVAVKDTPFFHDADIIVQLEDGQAELHSALACARCPFFEGLFAGRAAGRWLTGRHEEQHVQVDLTHVSKATFALVLQHMYAETEADLFADVVSKDTDDFLDVVLDVLSVANELMLDRLSQICQSVIGKYVNARNVCWLLNAISPSSVHEFKHAALEYLCLNLEAMLQGHYLNELDEDLLQELDDVVRQNQLSCMPFAKSSRSQLALHDRHPELALKLGQDRQIKIDAMRLRAKYQEMQPMKAGAIDDQHSSPAQTRSKRRPSQQTKSDDRPHLKAKASTKDMMFAMDEDAATKSPAASPAIRPSMTPRLEASMSTSVDDQWYNAKGKLLASPVLSAQRSPFNTPQHDLSTSATPRTPNSPAMAGKTPPSSGSPWMLTPLPAARSDFRNIMAQTSGSSGVSVLSQSLANGKSASPSATSLSATMNPKMSQKERKKQQQQQLSRQTTPSSPGISQNSPQAGQRNSPWQTVSTQKVPSLKDVLDVPTQSSINNKQSESTSRRSSTTPHLTMRQTLARTPPPPLNGESLPKRHGEFPQLGFKGPAADRPTVGQQVKAQSAPRSISYQSRPAESTLQLSISDIVAQQQAEKDIIREAVAKRDLNDIQAEQEFQEWWDKESRRVQEAEQRAGAPAKTPRRPKIRGAKNGGNKAGKSKANASASAVK